MKQKNNLEEPKNINTIGKDRFIFFNIFSSIVLSLVIYAIGRFLIGKGPFFDNTIIDLLIVVIGISFLSFFFGKSYWKNYEKKILATEKTAPQKKKGKKR